MSEDKRRKELCEFLGELPDRSRKLSVSKVGEEARHTYVLEKLVRNHIDAELRQGYGDAGATEAWRMLRYPVDHIETAAMRVEALAFLEQWL